MQKKPTLLNSNVESSIDSILSQRSSTALDAILSHVKPAYKILKPPTFQPDSLLQDGKELGTTDSDGRKLGSDVGDSDGYE